VVKHTKAGSPTPAVALDMLVAPDAGAGLDHDRCECGLADLQRVTPQVVAIQLDQVEGVQEHVPIILAVADTLERCEPVVIASDGFAIDDARPRAQAGERLGNQREAASHVIALAAVELHAVAILECDDAKSVVLDFMQPRVAERQLVGLCRKAAAESAGLPSTLSRSWTMNPLMAMDCIACA
jgi:hypothetical protein